MILVKSQTVTFDLGLLAYIKLPPGFDAGLYLGLPGFGTFKVPVPDAELAAIDAAVTGRPCFGMGADRVDVVAVPAAPAGGPTP
jgi:hypothetical protein